MFTYLVKKKEIIKFHDAFIKEYPDGRMTRMYFRRIYHIYFPFGDSTRFSDNMFKMFDRGNNGYVEFSEFVQGLSMSMRETLDNKLKCRFIKQIIVMQMCCSETNYNNAFYRAF